MQAQAVRTVTHSKSINATQSLAAVQTLLRAGLGAITFLRNLLPEENFSQSHLTTFDESLLLSSEPSFSQPESSPGDSDPRRNVNSFKITTMSRGYTDEADGILNYLEFGIFDALEKQYLRRFIFAIYLDNKNPQSIVEAYTFTFKYHKLEGHDVAFPVMTLEGGNYKGKQRQRSEDAVSKAIREGKVPTLRDVKTSVKAMLKNLIQAMNSLEVLPRRRFATFKVYYTDSTPSDYEPPYFHAGDVDKDRLYVMTHDLDEAPDRYSIGSVDTGHHSVSLNVTSIASFLPTSTAHDNAIFSGITNKLPGRLALTPLQEAQAAQDQMTKQLEDAKSRNVVWSVDDGLTDEDAEGEDDPEYTEQHGDGRPLGLLDEAGNIVALSTESPSEEETRFAGVSQSVPQNLTDIRDEVPNADIEETQQLTQDERRVDNDGPFDEEMLSAINLNNANDDEEMLDLETQVQRDVRPAETFGTMISTPGPASRPPAVESIDHGLECACGIEVEDPMCFCEAGCGRWFHVWCMGYHSASDSALPTSFHCFDCRVRREETWDLLKRDVYPGMLRKFQDLATFRRAIKVAEDLSRFNLIEFTKAFGGQNVLVKQMVNRLKDEEFIIDDEQSKYPTRHNKSNKSHAKPPKARKHVGKSAYYRFQRKVMSQDKYKQYFQPNDQSVEHRHLGIQDWMRSRRIEHGLRLGTKRAGSDDESVSRKRVKISVARPIDLAE